MFRKILVGTILAVIASADAIAADIEQAASTESQQSVVYFAHNPDAVSRLDENLAVSARMISALVIAATGQKDLASAWRSLIKPNERIGIKISAAGGRYFSTHPGVVEGIVAGLEQAGFSRRQIIVWDRDSGRLAEANFKTKPGGYLVRSIAPSDGYDRNAELLAPVLGRLIWGDVLFRETQQKRLGKKIPESEQLSSKSYLSKVLSQEVTKVINVPILSDEAGCGVAGALYNMTIPNLDNWRRFTQSDASGSDSIPGLYADEKIGPKVVLTIMDGLVAQYAGGPQGNPNYTFAHNTLYASTDPVAIDATAVRLIETWRQQSNLPPIGSKADWLRTAAEMGLGHFAEEEIALKEVPPGK